MTEFGLELLYGNEHGEQGGVNSRESLVCQESQLVVVDHLTWDQSVTRIESQSQLPRYLRYLRREHLTGGCTGDDSAGDHLACTNCLRISLYRNLIFERKIRIDSCFMGQLSSDFVRLERVIVDESMCFTLASLGCPVYLAHTIGVMPCRWHLNYSGHPYRGNCWDRERGYYELESGQEYFVELLARLWDLSGNAQYLEAFARRHNRYMHASNGNIDAAPLRARGGANPPQPPARRGYADVAANGRRGEDGEQGRQGNALRQHQRNVRHGRQQQHQNQRNGAAIDRGVNEHRLDRAYQTAVATGFRTAGALARFNEWAAANAAQINPASIPICVECGNAAIELCQHFVHEAAPAVEADVPVLGIVGRAEFANRWLWQTWVDGVRRAFYAPRFNLNVVNNHQIRGVFRDFDTSELTDDLICEELYSHIRTEMHVHYRVNGREDRDLRLEHCRKLARRWCEKKKIAVETAFSANIFVLTVQRACDQYENTALYAPQNPNWASLSLSFPRAWVCIVICAVIIFMFRGVLFDIAASLTRPILKAALQVMAHLMVCLIRLTGDVLGYLTSLQELQR